MPKVKPIDRYLTRVEAAEKHRTEYEEAWKYWFKRWRSYVDPIIDPDTKKPDTSRSNIFIPYTYVQVETILPRLVETLFAARPYVSVAGRTADDQERARANEILLDWQMNELMSFQRLFHSGLKGACIYGTTVAYTGWRWEQRTVIRREYQPVQDAAGNPIEGAEELKPVQSNDIVYDDPEVKFLDLGLFYVDPSASDVEDARYCGHIEYQTKAQLQAMVDAGIYKINWRKVTQDTNENKFRNTRLSEVGLPTIDDPDDEHGYYEVLHYWEDNKHAVIINRSELALDGPSPFWHGKKPYSRGVYCLVPGEFYGMGIPEILEDLQDELNTERNMRIDNRAFLLRRMMKVRRGSVLNKKQLKIRQGGIVEVEDMNDVQELNLGDKTGSSFMAESGIKRDMQDTTGGHDVVAGTNSGGETATTTMTKDNNAAMRFKLIISSLENDLLVSVARQMLQLNQQYMSDEKTMRITEMGETAFGRVSAAEIQGQFDLIAAGSAVEPLANKEANKQRMITLYSTLKDDPLITPYPDKRRNLLKSLLEAFDFKAIDKILPNEEELQAMMQPAQPSMSPGPAGTMTGGPNMAMMEEAGLVG